MTQTPNNTQNEQTLIQADFKEITQLVTAEFQIEEALIEQGTPTYYLVWPQETKEPFLRLLMHLEERKLIALLRKTDNRIVLRVVLKPPAKPSNPRTNLILFLATIATTFITGYISFPETGINPIVSGAVFSVAILLVLGIHEMGHKITANKKKIDASLPYFIPGPPPLGTLGAVIMQKSLPRNRDALFDVGANGPLAGFVIAIIFSVIGMTLLIPAQLEPGKNLIPITWVILMNIFSILNLLPPLVPPNNGWHMHPIAYAGWAGLIITMLNLLPAAMLDGGHVARSTLANNKTRLVLTFVSISLLLLVSADFIAMALLIAFMSMFKHPGPLDDVSSLDRNRKLLIIALVAVFILSVPIEIG